MTTLGIVAAVIVAYLIGSVSGSRVLAGLFAVPDIRHQGSHSAGATNAWRVGGAGYGLAVLGFDLLKGAVATGFVPALLADPMPWPYVCGVLAVAGHIWPIQHGFHGGKGVATAAGAMSITVPFVLLVALMVFAATLAWRRIVSLASLAAAFSAALIALLATGLSDPARLMIAALAVLLIIAHRENIVRLRTGREPRIDS